MRFGARVIGERQVIMDDPDVGRMKREKLRRVLTAIAVAGSGHALQEPALDQLAHELVGPVPVPHPVCVEFLVILGGGDADRLFQVQ
jgi:hypothetical protein